MQQPLDALFRLGGAFLVLLRLFLFGRQLRLVCFLLSLLLVVFISHGVASFVGILLDLDLDRTLPTPNVLRPVESEDILDMYF